MSATINQKDLKFVVFGSGHDYTLLDSGEGDGARIFSHPFMPKGARAYAGMYYFLVSDENGDPMDAVKDDIASCTFTPALGDTFDTVGEVEVKVYYRHEYIHDEETILVEKTVTQKITVVDHGTVATSYLNQSIYTDGYCYVHPSSDYVSRNEGYWFSGSFKKISSLPWGTTSMYNIPTAIEDISEMAYADMSGFTSFNKMFYSCSKLTNLSGVETWDTSKVTNMAQMFYGCNKLVSIEGVEKWNTAKVTNMNNMFSGCTLLADLTPLSTWNTSKVSNFQGMFWGCGIVTTDGLENFTFESTYNLYELFYACRKLTDLNGIKDWTFPEMYSLADMFRQCTALTDLTPLKNWDVSRVTNFSYMFYGGLSSSHQGKLLTLDGLEDWNVGNGINFSYMFGSQAWLNDISAVSGWNVSNGTDFSYMFDHLACLDLTDISGWDMHNATSLTRMFDNSWKCYSDRIGKYLVYLGYEYADYDGNLYMSYNITPPAVEYIEQDASAVSGWNVPNGSYAFFDGGSATWINIPSWN